MGVWDIRRPWTRQPQIIAPVNQGNPFTAGLEFLWVPVGTGVDVARRAISSAINSPELVVKPGGRGPNLNGSNQAVSLGRIFTGSAGTMLLYANFPTGTANSKMFFGQSSDAAGNLGIGIWGTGYSTVGGTTTFGTQSAGEHILIGGHDAAGMVAYADGVLTDSNATASSFTGDAAYAASLGSFFYSGGRIFYANETPYLAAFWNRKLSRSEAEALSDNPWQLFQPLPRRIWAPAAGVAGAISGASDLVFGGGSSTLTGAGALAGSAALTFGAGSSTLTAAGGIAGTAAMTFGAGSSALTGAGALAGSSAIAITPTGDLTGTAAGAMSGTAAMTFGGSAVLAGSGALAGTASMTFGAGLSRLTNASAAEDESAPHEDIDAQNEQIIQIVMALCVSGVLECR